MKVLNPASLAGKINTDKMKYPSFMMVLTGIGTYAYKRKDDMGCSYRLLKP